MRVARDGMIGGHLEALGISADAVRSAVAAQKDGDRRRLGEILVARGECDEQVLASALARQSGLPAAGAEDAASLRGLDLLPEAFMESRLVVPVGLAERRLRLLAADPYDMVTFGNLESSGLVLEVAVAPPSLILRKIAEREVGSGPASLTAALQGATGGGEPAAESEEDVDHLRDIASEAPVIRLVTSVIAQAVERRASDIHFEPFEGAMAVRLRIDGVLHQVQTVPRRTAPAVVSRIKIMARLNIAERRLPQDGRINTAAGGRDIDIRVSVVPTIHGESAALRILDRDTVPLSLAEIGMPEGILAGYRSLLARNAGVVLVTGPTGSGKTTTLYASLMELNDRTRKIITVEDPVEYLLEGVNQIPVRPAVGLTFAAGLRSIVRQDPDVIMVGEIRDAETARIAVQSAMTGHLVFSTVHTNDSAGAITRLLDMEIEDYLLTSSVIGVMAQRLARRVCPACRREAAVPEGLRRRVGDVGVVAPRLQWRGEGCPQCMGTGYFGRTGLFELLTVDDEVRRQILAEPSGPAIRRVAVSRGMVTMLADGVSKVAAGVTDLEEVLRVTIEEA